MITRVRSTWLSLLRKVSFLECHQLYVVTCSFIKDCVGMFSPRPAINGPHQKVSRARIRSLSNTLATKATLGTGGTWASFGQGNFLVCGNLSLFCNLSSARPTTATTIRFRLSSNVITLLPEFFPFFDRRNFARIVLANWSGNFTSWEGVTAFPTSVTGVLISLATSFVNWDFDDRRISFNIMSSRPQNFTKFLELPGPSSIDRIPRGQDTRGLVKATAVVTWNITTGIGMFGFEVVSSSSIFFSPRTVVRDFEPTEFARPPNFRNKFGSNTR